MKIFLDTANLEEIQRAADFGLLDGITTNPTLAAKEGRPFRELILKATVIVKHGTVNAEVVSTDTDGMLHEGRDPRECSPFMCYTVKVSALTSRWFLPLRKRFWRRRQGLISSARSWDDWTIPRRMGFMCCAKSWISIALINSPRKY
jgi:hypothetical protein